MDQDALHFSHKYEESFIILAMLAYLAFINHHLRLLDT